MPAGTMKDLSLDMVPESRRLRRSHTLILMLRLEGKLWDCLIVLKRKSWHEQTEIGTATFDYDQMCGFGQLNATLFATFVIYRVTPTQMIAFTSRNSLYQVKITLPHPFFTKPRCILQVCLGSSHLIF